LFSKEKVKVEDRLFSTLSTITRKIDNKKIPVLVTDTVGFIENLPTFIIDAFHSTLEEIELADIVLLVADISEEKDVIMNKLKVSIDELIEIGVKSPIIITLNKMDLLKKGEMEEKINLISKKYSRDGKKIIAISAKNKENIDCLLKQIYELLPQLIKIKLKIPMNSESLSLISWIYKIAHVTEITYNEEINVSIECNLRLGEKILARSKAINAELRG
jgi:GTP-binding protein HflX